MPAFYTSRSSSTQQLPLTPPDSGSGYGYSTMHYPQDPYMPHQSVNQPRHDSSFDYQQGYMQQSVASQYQYAGNGYQPNTSLPPIQSYYEPVGAPILPPLRIQDRAQYADDYQRRLQEQQSAIAREQQRQASKEEKATGGVSAKLDYDMERMTDFVTEATQSIFKHNMQSQPSFRKWVHQVLSATRLPSATILLSLHYLNDRVTRFADSITPGENQIYRLLAVSLILGSKFLDDNTFINRSWSDVTAIKVAELNLLEMKWLHLINYELHIDPTQTNGLKSWLDAWKDYDAKYTAKQLAAARLSPLDTNVHRHTPARDRYSPYPMPYTASSGRAYDTPVSSRSQRYDNYSAVDPWASTDRQPFDDFYKRQNRYPSLTEIDDVNRRASEERARQAAYAYPQSSHDSYYSSAAYGTAWDQSTSWGGAHRYDCNCSQCAYQQHYRHYPISSSYASAQTVMG